MVGSSRYYLFGVLLIVYCEASLCSNVRSDMYSETVSLMGDSGERVRAKSKGYCATWWATVNIKADNWIKGPCKDVEHIIWALQVTLFFAGASVTCVWATSLRMEWATIVSQFWRTIQDMYTPRHNWLKSTKKVNQSWTVLSKKQAAAVSPISFLWEQLKCLYHQINASTTSVLETAHVWKGMGPTPVCVGLASRVHCVTQNYSASLNHVSTMEPV